MTKDNPNDLILATLRLKTMMGKIRWTNDNERLVSFSTKMPESKIKIVITDTQFMIHDATYGRTTALKDFDKELLKLLHQEIALQVKDNKDPVKILMKELGIKQ